MVGFEVCRFGIGVFFATRLVVLIFASFGILILVLILLVVFIIVLALAACFKSGSANACPAVFRP